MSSYKFKDNTLRIRKVDIDEELFYSNINVMEDLQQSYRTYLMETIHKDFKFFEEELRSYKQLGDVTVDVKVGQLVTPDFNKTQVRQGNAFYPVSANFYRRGMLVSTMPVILRIPYMDDYGKLNINGKSRIVNNVQRSAEDISYNMKDNMFNIAMPYANVRIYASSKHIKMSYGKRRISMTDIVTAMLYDAGDKTRLHEYLRNTVLVNALDINPYVIPRSKSDSMHRSTDLLEKLQSEQYKLGYTRKALNEALNLNRAEGMILSRDVLSYKAGTSVTKAIISDLKRNRINVIYVRNNQMPDGYMLSSPAPMIFPTVPAGTVNCTLLRERLPEYKDIPTIPTDVVFSQADCIIIPNNRPLTKQEVEFIINMGILSLDVKASTTGRTIKFNFEREIVGNYTAKLGELTDVIPKDRYADEWVYYFNNPDLKPCNPDNLTAHDLVAILSVIGGIMLTGKSVLLDRDTSFLKKVMLVNEVFSETLRKAMRNLLKKYHNSLGDAINSQAKVSSSALAFLTSDWIKVMTQGKFLSTVDSINLAAEVSQVNHIVTEVTDSSSVKDEQRHLAMPFYGRICPYETPAGKKLGIVNTKAIGTRIKDGLMLAPYRKIVRSGDGIRVSNNISWLSVKDELKYKFGDILSFKYDENGKILNTPILAKVPNTVASDEPFVFRNIMAYDLASGEGGYVTAYPEQFLSPTAALVPFACSDNPVRISFGLSQMKQAVYLHNSQKPLVVTPMYKKIFEYSDAISYSAVCDGRITSIDNNVVHIADSNGVDNVVYMQGGIMSGSKNATFDLLVKSGDYVKTGEKLAVAHKYPQSFVTRAPFDCKILEITGDSIQISRNTSSNRMMVDLEKDGVDYVAISNSRIMGQTAIFTNIHVSVGDVVKKGDVLADTCMSRQGVYSPSRQPLVAYIANGYNYEDGICATELASINYTSMIVHGKDEEISKRKYPNARSSRASGFKYCGPNDKIATIKMYSDGSKGQSITHSVFASNKEHGIPFETSITEDSKFKRAYRYYLLGFNKLKVGDKMSGRHGNKGVVSKVLPDSQAYQLLNGKTVEFYLNPCGVPSRMNLGQIYDAHMGLIATVLGITIDVDAFNGATTEDVSYLMHYTWELANTEAIGSPYSSVYNRAAFDAVCAKYRYLPKELHEAVWKNIANVIDWRGVFDQKGDAELYDPITGTMLDGKVTIGYPTFFKLMQEADEKLNVRGGPLDEQYARTTSQPQKGFGSAKGQRMAEMELMALAAMGCADIIDETINELSDNSGRRINNHLKQLGIGEQINSESCTSRAVESLIYMLEACGVHLDLPKSVAATDYDSSASKYTMNIHNVIHEEFDEGVVNKHSKAEDFYSVGDDD